MKESQIHQALSKWLDSEKLLYIHSRTDRKTSQTLGDPDFIVWHCGRAIGVEIKVVGNKLSVAQVERIADLRANGNEVHVCYSLEAAIEAVRAWCGIVTPDQSNAATESLATPEVASVHPLKDQLGQPFFILSVLGRDWLCSGQFWAGGEFCKVREATCQDLRIYPRK
jgi:hypothetical protein